MPPGTAGRTGTPDCPTKPKKLSPIQEMSNEEWSSPEAEAPMPSPVRGKRLGVTSLSKTRPGTSVRFGGVGKAPDSANGGHRGNNSDRGRIAEPNEPRAILSVASAGSSAKVQHSDVRQQKQQQRQKQAQHSVCDAGPASRRNQTSLPSRPAGVGNHITNDELIDNAARELSFEFLQYAAVNPRKAARAFLEGRNQSPAVTEKIAEKLSSEPFRLFAGADPKNAAEMLLLVEISSSTPGSVPMQQQSEPGSGNKIEVWAKADQGRGQQQQQSNALRRVYDEDERIIKPGPYDVVLGQGKWNYPGNAFVRDMANVLRPSYQVIQKRRKDRKNGDKDQHPLILKLVSIVMDEEGGRVLEKKQDHFVFAEEEKRRLYQYIRRSIGKER